MTSDAKSREAELAAQIDELRADVKALAETLGRIAGEEAQALKERAHLAAERLKEDGRQRIHDADAALHQAADSMTEAVRRQPAAAIGLAAAAGFLVGLLVGRK